MGTLISEGVTKQVLTEGNGPAVKKGDKITVHCTGSLADTNKKFWSTKDPGQSLFTFSAGIGQVIAGWDEGCMTMRKGETSLLTVAGHKGYGAKGFPAWGITPNATLTFEIEIVKINGQ